jgi:hypothetical protein
VQWAWALPLVAAHALLAVQHLPPCCSAASAIDGIGGRGSWAAGYACGRGAAAVAAHWLLMALLPAVVMRAVDAGLRRQFLRQPAGSCA